jgi:Mce-associated membrane protein
VLAIVLAVAALTVLRPSSDDEVRESALLAARTYTQSLVTYDARTLEEDVARVRRASTEEFATQYDETINGLRETIVSEQRVSTGPSVGAGLEELDDTTATVLVAGRPGADRQRR